MSVSLTHEVSLCDRIARILVSHSSGKSTQNLHQNNHKRRKWRLWRDTVHGAIVFFPTSTKNHEVRLLRIQRLRRMSLCYRPRIPSISINYCCELRILM